MVIIYNYIFKINDLTVIKLREILRNLKKPSSGRKVELINRIKMHYSENNNNN